MNIEFPHEIERAAFTSLFYVGKIFVTDGKSFCHGRKLGWFAQVSTYRSQLSLFQDITQTKNGALNACYMLKDTDYQARLPKDSILRSAHINFRH